MNARERDDRDLELVPPPEPKPGKSDFTGKMLFDRILSDAATRPEPTPDECCAMGFCPECIHDMLTVKDGQVCPKCGFFTELSYLPPAERES